MKRRRFVQAALALPAGSAALLAQAPVQGAGVGSSAAAPTATEYPKLDTVAGEQAGEPVVRFFSSARMATMKRLADLLMPRSATAPGAVDAGAPEFLDFWLGKAQAPQQKVYITGLEALNKAAMGKYRKPFAELDDASAAAVIEPAIKVPWNYSPPADPLAHFLQEAKRDIRAATVNSREYSVAMAAGGGRRQGGMGMYWNPLD